MAGHPVFALTMSKMSLTIILFMSRSVCCKMFHSIQVSVLIRKKTGLRFCAVNKLDTNTLLSRNTLRLKRLIHSSYNRETVREKYLARTTENRTLSYPERNGGNHLKCRSRY